jgi:hypothetical protein
MSAMSSDLQTLPESRQELVKIIDSLTTRNEQLETKVRWFEEQFHLARHKQFGASSERSVTAQGDLFNEGKQLLTGPVEEQIRQTITYERKKPGRRPIPKDLPIERIEYRLPEEEQICTACGAHLHEMSEELRHEVKLIPAQVRMVQHARIVWVPQLRKEQVSFDQNCRSRPVIGARFPRPHLVTMKFVESSALPEEQHYTRMRLTVGAFGWMLKSGDGWSGFRLSRNSANGTLHTDEPDSVLKEPGKAAESQSYMWLYRTGTTGPPIVLFEYQPSLRETRRFLAGS